jgi:hypothetical protein
MMLKRPASSVKRNASSRQASSQPPLPIANSFYAEMLIANSAYAERSSMAIPKGMARLRDCATRDTSLPAALKSELHKAAGACQSSAELVDLARTVHLELIILNDLAWKDRERAASTDSEGGG